MSTFTSKLSPGDVFHDRMIRLIKCPAGSVGVTAILLQNAEGESIGEFKLCDANGDSTEGLDNAWSAGCYIQVLFDMSSCCAQVLNGANNFASKTQNDAMEARLAAVEERIAAIEERITEGTADITAGESALETGKIYLVYE